MARDVCIRNPNILVVWVTPPAEEKKRTMIVLVRNVAPVGTFPVKPIGVWDPQPSGGSFRLIFVILTGPRSMYF